MPPKPASAVAMVLALVVAAAAAFALSPWSGVLDPLPVEAAAEFTASQLDRARDFRGPQRTLFLVTLLIQAALLVALVVYPPHVLLRVRRRPALAAGLAGAAIALAVVLGTLPVDAVMRQRSLDVGLATRSWAGWASDVVRSAAISALFAGAATAAAVALMRRFPCRWWLPASGLVAAAGAALVFAGPLVIEPIFNRFEELPAGPARNAVTDLANRAGVEVGDVFVVDASKRTTSANAYVTGLGSSKRVVLYDTLLRDFGPRETRLVVAHELAHVRHNDVPRGLLFLLFVSPAAMFAVARLTRSWAPDEDQRPGPQVVPALTLAFALIALLIGTVSNQLSRRVEARADSTALTLTGDADAFIAQQRRLALQNVSDPQPPAIVQLLLGSHPTTVERIGAGRAWEAGQRP